MNLPELEYQVLANGLIQEESTRFKAIRELADERVKWQNEHAHAEDCNTIYRLVGEILTLANRRHQLQVQHEQAKHTGPRT